MGVVLPILWNHDQARQIGYWEAGGVGEISPGVNITVDQLFAIFGGAGVKILAKEIVCDEVTGKFSTYVRRFEIIDCNARPTIYDRELFDGAALGAIISTCGRYRYTLERRWAADPRYVLWLMLNPSTADGLKNDATIRRCMGFAHSWGYTGILVGNLYALRATHPTDLFAGGIGKPFDAVGPENDRHIDSMARRASIIVCAWGQRGPDRSRRQKVLRLIRTASWQDVPPLHYLTMNSNGEPGHPLRLRGTLTPTAWDGLREAPEGGNG